MNRVLWKIRVFYYFYHTITIKKYIEKFFPTVDLIEAQSTARAAQIAAEKDLRKAIKILNCPLCELLIFFIKLSLFLEGNI